MSGRVLLIKRDGRFDMYSVTVLGSTASHFLPPSEVSEEEIRAILFSCGMDEDEADAWMVQLALTGEKIFAEDAHCKNRKKRDNPVPNKEDEPEK